MSTTNPASFIGGKLPPHSLWQQLELAGCTLEFCSQFFNDKLSYPEAQKWLVEHGIKISVKAISGFFNSLDMRMRYAVKESEVSATRADGELPADIDKLTRDRIKQHKFELAFTNLSEAQRLQLIQIQQNEDAMAGNYELKKAKLDLDRERLNRLIIKHYMDFYADKKSREILESPVSNADKFEQLGLHHFGRLWSLGTEVPAAPATAEVPAALANAEVAK